MKTELSVVSNEERGFRNEAAAAVGRLAECNSAIQQIENLRYGGRGDYDNLRKLR